MNVKPLACMILLCALTQGALASDKVCRHPIFNAIPYPLFRPTDRDARDFSADLREGPIPLRVVKIADWSTLVEGSIGQVVQSPDHPNLIAIAAEQKISANQFEMLVKVIDLEDGNILLQMPFTKVKKVQFLPGSKSLAVEGARLDGRPQLFRIDLSHRQNEADWIPIPEGSYGTGVAQIVPLAENGFLIVQDSRYRLQSVMANVNTDPRGPLLNQNATMFSAAGNHVSPLAIGDRVPILASPSPTGHRVALLTVDPHDAGKNDQKDQKIVVVDLLKPDEILYEYTFGRTKYLLQAVDTERTIRVDTEFQFSWSVDGQRLLVLERLSGSLIQIDLSHQYENEVVDYDKLQHPTLAAQLLESGRTLVLRQAPLQNVQEMEELFEGYPVEGTLYHPGESLEPKPPQFRVRLPILQGSLRTAGGILLPPKRRSIIEMQNGQVWAVVMDSHIVWIDAQNPNIQRITVLPQKPVHPQARVQNPNRLTLAEKLSETRLRVGDRDNGIYEIDLMEPPK